jgi:hypothetical protein
MQQTISIARRSFNDQIDADVEGPFAIHETVPCYEDPCRWTLTHVPTGHLMLDCAHRSQCVAARAEWLVSDLDWSFSDPKAVTAPHRAFGLQMQRKYGHRQ